MARIAPDANDVLVHFLNDTAGTHVNAGTAGSAGNFTDYGSPIFGATGVLGDAVYMPSSYLVNARNGTGGANDVLVTPNVSLSGWVFMRRATNYPAELFNKQYYLNGWAGPFLTFGFQTHSTNDGQCDLYIVLNGTLQFVRTPAAFPMPIGKWSHIGGTWDGTTLRFYVNGSLSVSSNFSGVIDYNSTSSRGQWYTGGIPGTSNNQDPPAIIQDIRVANIARPQSYFANIYNNGLYVNG